MTYTSMLIVRLVRHGTAAPSVVVPYSSIKTSAFIRSGDLAPGRQGDFLLIPVPFELDLYRLATLIRWVSSNLPKSRQSDDGWHWTTVNLVKCTPAG